MEAAPPSVPACDTSSQTHELTLTVLPRRPDQIAALRLNGCLWASRPQQTCPTICQEGPDAQKAKQASRGQIRQQLPCRSVLPSV